LNRCTAETFPPLTEKSGLVPAVLNSKQISLTARISTGARLIRDARASSNIARCIGSGQSVPARASESLQTSPTELTSRPSYLALVVDDSLAVRKLMELELRMLSIHADFAENGSQALDFIKRNVYDIIFLHKDGNLQGARR
jgi:hypothetical protein